MTKCKDCTHKRVKECSSGHTREFCNLWQEWSKFVEKECGGPYERYGD